MASPARIVGLALLLALLGWAVWETKWTPQPAALPDAAAEATPLPATPPQQFAPLSDYRITLERPLFFPGRRLPGETAAATEAMPGAGRPVTPGSAPRLTLSAVIEENGKRSALLTVPGQAASTRVQEGESIGGWRLVSIADDSVTVEANGKSEQLPLRDYGAAPSAPPVRAALPRTQLARPSGGASNARQPE